MKKSFFAILCLLLFLCVGMAQAALAADDAVEVLRSDGTYFKTYDGLQNAINKAAEAGIDKPTFVLLRSFSVGKVINLKDATLDMREFSLNIENSMTFTNVKIVGKETKEPKSSLTIVNGQGTVGSLKFNGKVSFENVRIEGLKGKLTVGQNVEVKLINSTVDLNERFIEVLTGGTLIVDRSTIENGSNITRRRRPLFIEKQAYADNTNIKNPEGKGGAIYAQAGAKVTITNSTLSKNKANFGGAIFICGDDEGKNEAALVIEGSTFEDNVAKKEIELGTGTELPSRGGAIYIFRNKASIEKSTFKNNQSFHGGGAIFIYGKSEDNGAKKAAQLEVLGTEFISNQSGERGGAITVSEFTSARFLAVDGKATVFKGNSLTSARQFSGGAMFIDRSYVYMEDVLITGNAALDAGGGISTCSTGTADIRPLRGAMIYENEAGSTGKVADADKYPDVHFLTIDHLDYTDPDNHEYIDGRDRFSTVGLKYELHEQMFNGGMHNWSTKEFSTNKEEESTGIIRKFHSFIAKASPDDTGTETHKPQVIFEGNTAMIRSQYCKDSEIISGGAIADNGLLEIGSRTKIRIVKVWEGDNAYGYFHYRPSVERLLRGMFLFKNDRNGPQEKSMGSLSEIKMNQRDDIIVHVLTDEEKKDCLPYSSVVFGKKKKSVIDHIYDNDINNKHWIVPLENVWVIDIDNLPGNPYGYTVKEVDIGGYKQIEEWTSDPIFTNKIKETTQLSVKKVWKNDEGHSAARPDSVTVNLLADGKKVTQKVLKGPDWAEAEVVFENLPVYRNGPNDVKPEYTVEEVRVKDYTPTYTVNDNQIIITNTYTPGKTEVAVSKEWVDGDNQDGIRPESVTVHLLKDGADTGKKLVLSHANSWVGQFIDLDDNGEYTIWEEKVDGYKTAISGDQQNGFEITNTHEPEMTAVTATKEWFHKNNDQSAWPTEVIFRLRANGVEKDFKKVTKANGWKVTFDNLPKYEGGKNITYTITEDHVPDYTHRVNRVNEKKLTVTNTYNPGKTDVEVEKEWEDNDDQYKIRPEQVTVHLYANGVKTEKQLKLNAATEWQGVFEELDEKDENGKIIDYYVVEDPVEGYKSFVEGDAEKGFTIVNEFIPEENEHFMFTKVWIGGNENEISWKFFSQEGKPLNQKFKKKKLSDSEWLYESMEKVDRDTYLIEEPVPGYVTQYENVGVHAKVTDRLYSGGKILNVKIPQTGDKENLWVGLGLGALSLLGMIVLLRRSRKHRSE